MSLLPIQWKDNALVLLDQRAIPHSKSYFTVQNLDQGIFAIREMIVRGAPAIAITGMYSLAVDSIGWKNKPSYSEFLNYLQKIQESRPTAVNLSRAIQEIKTLITPSRWEKLALSDVQSEIKKFADTIWHRDLEDNLSIGNNGLELFSDKDELHIITHCNTGALATAGHGTALGIIRSLHQSGKRVHVYADETRPFLQGSRLTAFEMKEEGIDCTIICDNMSAWLMNDQKIDAVIVGCDRVSANGDVANKIGTYGLAIIAKEHSVPFFVAATKDSFDLSLKHGSEIPIEMRNEKEVLEYHFLKTKEGAQLVSPGTTSPVSAKALNPGFDVTPAKYVSALITEMGVVSPVTEEGIRRLLTSFPSKLT